VSALQERLFAGDELITEISKSAQSTVISMIVGQWVSWIHTPPAVAADVTDHVWKIEAHIALLGE
jgi:hypothetical protein